MEDQTRLAVALEKVEAMSSDLKDIKATLHELTKDMGRLRVLEERQMVASENLARAFAEISRVETKAEADNAALATRVSTLESAAPVTTWTNSLVQKVIWVVLAFVLGLLLQTIVPFTIKAPPAPQYQGVAK